MKFLTWIKAHKILSILAGLLIIIIGAGLIFARGGGGDEEIVLVERRDVIETVRVSGTVEAEIVSDVGFEASGVIRNVYVKVNDTVRRGTRLADLGMGTLPAQLQSAEAALAIKRAESANTSINLSAIEEKHDTFVANAESELLSDDLIAEAHSSTYTMTPPVISGRYEGPRGTYKIRIDRGVSNEYDLYVFDMENVEPVEINKTGSTPLGERGLFISFPDGISSYDDTTWYITTPNKKGSSYSVNVSAWEDALAERERALKSAEEEIRAQGAGSSIAEAQLLQAEAEVARIRALMAERTLVAPFDGIVTAVEIDPGETAGVGDSAMSLISTTGFGVEVDLPEVDSIRVRSGNPAEVVLDALPSEPFSATVVSVNRTETIVDGVSVYEARLAFGLEDERIISGMTADVTITANKKENVLALPARALKLSPDGSFFVNVYNGDTKEITETPVTTGLRGGDGFVEIIAGLGEGVRIVVSHE
ncbi:MAG: efflux RND transporter periplasmic adaptor subunit [Patescibacteria group bacterium]